MSVAVNTKSIEYWFKDSLPTAVQSNDLALEHLKYSMVAGFGIFLICLPFCVNKGSIFSPISARRTLFFARFLVFAELLLVFTLFYFYGTYGSPVKLHQYLSYGNGDGWLYTFGRPTGALITFGLAMTPESHPLLRFISISGCIITLVGDSLSAFQVRDYYHQILHDGAPRHGYHPNSTILAYYWRDIISVGNAIHLSTFIFF